LTGIREIFCYIPIILYISQRMTYHMKHFVAWGVQFNDSLSAMTFIRSSHRHLAGLLLALMLLACVLGGTAVVLLEANHECTGGDCPICELVAMAHNSLAFTCRGSSSLTGTAICLATEARLCLRSQVMACPGTLVHRKVRFNN